jgi:hypothetical protein
MAAREPSRRSIALRDLALRLNRSERTARRLWAQPRTDYETEGSSRKKPWEAEGIARSTWYRRRQHRRHAGSVIDDDADDGDA